VLRGKIFVPGGKLEDGTTTDVLEVYDLTEETWDSSATLPQKISGYALTTFEGQMFLLVGGMAKKSQTPLIVTIHHWMSGSNVKKCLQQE